METYDTTPIYKRIADDYRNKINSGELPAGSLIPPQTSLARLHGTSEVTIRKALQVLVEDGLIYRVRKKGTFVSGPNDHRTTNSHSKEDDIKRVYFVYNGVPISLITQEIHKAMMDGISDACSTYGIELVFLNVRGTSELPDDKEAGYLVWGLEWISITNIENWAKAGYKMVTLHNYFPHLDIPYVNCDNYTGGYLAAQHLLSLGHRRIGVVLLGRSNYDIEREWALRLQGFHLAHKNNGIEYDHELIYVDRPEHDDLEELGYNGMKKLMAIENPPTAVFAAADFAAFGAMQAAEDLHLSIPNDVSIIGYDGYSFGTFTNPSITTVQQNFYDLGKFGLEKLIHPQSQAFESLVPPQLIVRQSTGRMIKVDT